MRPYLRTLLLILCALGLSSSSKSQIDSVWKRINLEGDFRFRIEQDWNSRTPEGKFRDDRTRLRYRLRFGANYTGKWYETGFRIRTGDPKKQQDPQLTLGTAFEEFGTLPIGFEKVYFLGKLNSFVFGLGKVDYPFEKNNELFWSDNVYPEGVFISKGFKTRGSGIDTLDIRAGHFILSASGRSLDMDTYFQGFQVNLSTFNSRLDLFPSFYYFSRVPNIPDGAGTYTLNYAIVHGGLRLKLLKNRLLQLEFDLNHNLEDYNKNDSIPDDFKDQKTGFVAAVAYGQKRTKGDWFFKATYSWLQQYSIVDIMAQNDWARWDYSAFGSPDGRLSNMQGVELVGSYTISPRVVLTAKYYHIVQLRKYGTHLETNDRFRFDIDVKF